jgi:hypothetical protein
MDFGEVTGIPKTTDTFDVSYPSTEGEWRFPMDTFDRFMRPTPGPLMTSALAMFGKDSFFYVASNSSTDSYPTITQQICQADNIPLTRLSIFGPSMYDYMFSACFDIDSPYSTAGNPLSLDPLLYEWISTFNPDRETYVDNHVYSKQALEVAMFFANQHWLLETAAATRLLYTARSIFTSPGSPVARPVVPLYAKITVSLLIALQLLGLALLAKFIYSIPTWTEKLDSTAMAQLTHDVDSGIFSVIRKPDQQALKQLGRCNGIVGLVEKNEDADVESMSDGHGSIPNAHEVDPSLEVSAEEHTQPVLVDASREVKLSRGGSGFVTREYASFREWKPKFKFRRRRKAAQESVLEKGDADIS